MPPASIVVPPSARHDVRLAADGGAAVTLLEAEEADVVLTDVRMSGLDGFELGQIFKRRWLATEVVLMTAHATIPAAVEAMGQEATTTSKSPSTRTRSAPWSPAL